MATVYVGGASIDENGRAHGGQAGNQTGRELKKQRWYRHQKGWRVFRAKDAGAAARIAACMRAAVENRHIGYDQYQRNTLYDEAKQYGFDVARVTKDVETDCSALVRVCCAYAGILDLPSGFRTTNEPKNLLRTGAFTELTGARYTDASTRLRAGDILCTATQGHTVVVLNDGAKAGADAPESGEAAKVEERMVEVTGGTVNVRAEPGTAGRKLGVVRKGERLPYQGESRDVGGTMWHGVAYKGQNAWISGKYSRVAEA